MRQAHVLRSVKTLTIAALIAIFLACFWGQQIRAQESSSPDLSQKIDTLTNLLNDPQIKAALARSGTAEPPPPADDMKGMENAMDGWVGRITTHLDDVAAAAHNLGPDLGRLSQRLVAISGHFVWIKMWALAALTIGLAFGIEALCRRHMAKAMHVRATPHMSDRELHYAVPAFTFCVAVVILFFVMPWQASMISFARPILLAAIFLRLVYWLTRLSGRTADVAVNPQFTTFWQNRVILISWILAIAYVLGRAFTLLDAPVSTLGLLRYASGLLILLIAAVSIWTSPGKYPDHPAEHYVPRVLLTIWLVMVALFDVLGTAVMFYVAVLAVLLPIALRITTRIIHAVFADPTLEGPQAKRHGMLLVLAERSMRALLIGAAALWATWRLKRDTSSLSAVSPDSMDRITHAMLNFVVIAVLADLAWHILKSFVESRIETSGEAGNGRLRTLLPIFRSMAGVLILGISVMMVLSSAGIEIAPLLAGAGIFGVAIGFGSQTLVKDVISGIFYMLDDAFRVGEYIQSGSYKGVVEGFSLRSVRLRHHRGPVYTVPFGSLGAIQNMSRDWSKDKFLITVPYDTDIEKVRKLVKKVGETLLADPEVGPLFLQPIKMKGVESFGEYGISLGVAMIVKPTPLLSMIRRRAYMMIRQSFRENGVEFAVPTVNVAGTTDSDAEAAASAYAVKKNQMAKLDPPAP